MSRGSIVDVPGVKVGHFTDKVAATGCTVVLCEAGAVIGVDVRGSAPGTRETDLASPTALIQHAHAVLLSGGSAFGLAAADGVMRYLESRGIGFDTGFARIPIVPAAVIFDLGIGDSQTRPGPDAGYAACQESANPLLSGSVGAGTGATVGKILGPARAVKGGVGTASLTLANGLTVAAIVVVNAFGDIIDPSTGAIVAGARAEHGFAGTERLMLGSAPAGTSGPWSTSNTVTNTTIGVVVTNAALAKPAVSKIAQMAHDGLARTIRPVHTMVDGDTIFALATGEQGAADINVIGTAAAKVVELAVLDAVESAESIGGVPAARDLAFSPFFGGS